MPRPGLYREVILLAYPVVLSHLANSLMGLTDIFFMGWVSTAAQGGVGLGALLNWTCGSFFIGTLTIINTFVAQHFGAGERARCGPVVWHGLLVTLLFSVVLLPLAGPLSRLVLLFGAPEAVNHVATSYTLIRLLGLPVMMADTCVQSFLRGLGDTRTPMKIAAVSVLLNIPLNYWLVFGGLGVPPLGPDGSALATVAAQTVGALLLLHVLLRAPMRREFGTGLPRRWPLRPLGLLLKVGLPVGVSWSLEMVTWLAFSGMISAMGRDPLAAHNIVMQVLQLSFMPGLALSVAATTLVGQRLGASDADGAARCGYASIKLAMAYMGAMGIAFLLLGGLITTAFNRDPEVVAIGRRLFMMAAAFQLFDAIGMVSGGILRGAGDTRGPMVISVSFAWLVFLPLTWLLGRRLGWGVTGSWLGATTYIIALGVAMLARVLAGRWKSYSVRRGEARSAEGREADEGALLPAPKA
jgi:multidrug resistance protein, MATE family